jgi:hypothetical protein
MLFEKIDARQYAALRIAFGALAFLSLAGRFSEASFYYSDAGWFPLQAALANSDARAWTLLRWITSPLGVKLFFAAAMAAAASMTAGYHSRLSSWATFVAVVSIYDRNWLNAYGGDAVLRVMLFLVALCPSGLAWSADAARLRRPAGKAEAWPLRLMQAQVCLIYLTVGWMKLHGKDWIDGTALGLVLLNPVFARADYAFIQTQPIAAFALKAMTRLTLAWEILFSLLVLSRWTRWVALAVGAVIHIGIVLLFQMHWFGELMLASYLAFLPDGWFGRVEGLIVSTRAGRAPAPRSRRLAGSA